MFKLNKYFLSAVAGLVLAGCASTSENSGGQGQYPVLKVMSDKPYVWDDSISEALNVARMAQPAGVGNGMRDFADGTQANTGRISGGTRLFDAGLGLLGQGIFGVVAFESLNQSINRQLDWKPSLVQLFDVENIGNPNGVDFLKVREKVLDSITMALKKEYKDIKVLGYFTSKGHDRTPSNAFVAFSSSSCLDAAKLDYYYVDNAKIKSLGLTNGLLESPVELVDFCAVSVRIAVSGIINDKYIVVSEVQGTGIGTHYFDMSIANNLEEGYFIMPEYYDFVVSDRPGVRKGVNHNYAKVYFNGREILFQK